MEIAADLVGFFALLRAPGSERVQRGLPSVIVTSELGRQALHLFAKLIHLLSGLRGILRRYESPLFSIRVFSNLNGEPAIVELFACFLRVPPFGEVQKVSHALV